MELAEKLGSNYTISNGIMEEMSSRLQILDCENGKSTNRPHKKQYDRTGQETGGHGHIQPDHPTSFVETFMHLLRGNIGVGVFGMGDAFKHGGILLGPLLTCFIGLISVHCQHILMTCSRNMRELQSNANEKDVNMDNPDFAETVELCFIHGSPRAKKYSRLMKFLVNFFIVLTQLGFCCIYFVFVSKNLEQFWNHYVDYDYDHYIKFAFILLPILLLCMITDLKYLTPASTIANICMATCMVLTFYFMFQDLPPISERRAIGHIKDLPLFFGTAIFAFEGIALVLPLKNAMKKPKLFNRPIGVLNVGMVLIASLFVAVGFVGYWRYGENVEATVTMNLPKNDPLAQVIKLMVCIGILLTYPLQFFVGVQIMWSAIEERHGPLKRPLQTQLLFRAFLVLLTFSLSEIVPELNSFISLIGALCSTGLALVFPPIIQMVSAYGTSEGSSGWFWAKNASIICLALLGLFTGTYESIQSLIKAFNKHH